ncbi:MAG: hypothetical protein DWQ02_23910 [Bacteroidetes bacterium]|nr:MAG: hypothetical protein DWQ02_23910 [Bacteroidota bacterium]
MKQTIILIGLLYICFTLKAQDETLDFWKLNKDTITIKRVTFEGKKKIKVDSIPIPRTKNQFSYQDSKVYIRPEKFAKFPGGEKKLYDYIQTNLIYPDYESNIQFSVLACFIVNELGEITNIGIRRSIGYDYDKISIEIVKNMPNWIPAEVNGEKVKSFVVLPIKFY